MSSLSDGVMFNAHVTLLIICETKTELRYTATVANSHKQRIHISAVQRTYRMQQKSNPLAFFADLSEMACNFLTQNYIHLQSVSIYVYLANKI